MIQIRNENNDIIVNSTKKLGIFFILFFDFERILIYMCIICIPIKHIQQRYYYSSVITVSKSICFLMNGIVSYNSTAEYRYSNEIIAEFRKNNY